MSEKFPIPAYKNMIVREAAVDQGLSPEDSVQMAVNLHGDRIGAITSRLGTTRLGSQISAGSSILGLGTYRNNAGTIYAPLAMVGNTVKAYQALVWGNIRTGLVSGSKARFTNFVDYTFMVNGHSNDAVASWSGVGLFGTTNVASLPKGDFIENYRSRIWVADNSDDSVYYTDVVNTDNTISGGTEFIQISPADGEKITAIKRSPRALLVFKQNHIYRIFSINSADPDPAILRGTYSQESVVEAKDGIYYHHSTGFYKYVDGGEQEEISRPINDIIKSIPRSSYENITGWADEDHIYWSIGDVTLEGITFQNLVCRRTISTQLWTIYSYPNEFRSSILFDDGVNLFQLLGDTDGNVLKFDIGNDDFGSPIFYDLISHWTYFTDNKRILKTFTKMAALSDNATGANISYQIDTDNQKDTTNVWRPVGTIKKDISYLMSVAEASNFQRIRFRISGSNSGVPLIFRQFEIIDLATQDPDSYGS